MGQCSDGLFSSKQALVTADTHTCRMKEKSLFGKELRPMMYGFGDGINPRPDTVELVEELMLDYIYNILVEAHKVALLHGGKVKTEDFLFVLRRDTKKYARVEELLFMNEDLKRARQAFDTEELPQ